jgi:hypothetical protein
MINERVCVRVSVWKVREEGVGRMRIIPPTPTKRAGTIDFICVAPSHTCPPQREAASCRHGSKNTSGWPGTVGSSRRESPTACWRDQRPAKDRARIGGPRPCSSRGNCKAESLPVPQSTPAIVTHSHPGECPGMGSLQKENLRRLPYQDQSAMGNRYILHFPACICMVPTNLSPGTRGAGQTRVATCLGSYPLRKICAATCTCRWPVRGECGGAEGTLASRSLKATQKIHPRKQGEGRELACDWLLRAPLCTAPLTRPFLPSAAEAKHPAPPPPGAGDATAMGVGSSQLRSWQTRTATPVRKA